jgi:hypothetical protein
VITGRRITVVEGTLLVEDETSWLTGMGTKVTSAQLAGREPENTLMIWPCDVRQKMTGLLENEGLDQESAAIFVKVVVILPRGAVESKAALATPGLVEIFVPIGVTNSPFRMANEVASFSSVTPKPLGEMNNGAARFALDRLV